MVIDTGATHTIVRKDLLPAWRLNASENYIITTASGEVMDVSGEMTVDIEIGSKRISHKVFVAEITDPVILGMDFMNYHKVILDVGQKSMKIGDEEFILRTNGGVSCLSRQLVLAEDVILPGRSETVTSIKLEGNMNGMIGVLEPASATISNGILLGRTLISAKTNTIPARLLNTKNFEQKLKKGTIVGQCEEIQSVMDPRPNEPNSSGKRQLENKAFEDFVAKTVRNLRPEEKTPVEGLLNKFHKAFSMNDGDLGKTDMVQHRINTGDHSPIKQAPRRVPLAKQDEVDKLVKDMKAQGVIQTSSSPWASPIVLVKKKDGSTRFCVDYRKLNDITKKDSYPLPRIDDTLDTLSGATWFSTLDLKSGYWQVEIHPDDKEKTAFSTGTGLWQFNVMPFGLCNAPATFERLMETVLQGLHWKTCLVYLDDVIIFSKSFEEHLRHLEDVLEKLSNAGLKLSFKKCDLFGREVKYLGHVISSEGVKTDPEKTDAVRSWPVPKDKHQVRSYLGLCTYYRRFVQGFAEIARPLHRLTENDQPFEWSQKCQEAFDRLKDALCSAPVLAYPRPGGKFIVDTDASNVGIGGVLSQVQDGEERVIAYFSKTLSKPEKNYCVTRKELLAIVKTLEHFHKYLYGQPFLLRTDHASLTWLLNFKNPEGQIARWVERLQEYDFKIEHRRGKLHGNADALSRRPCDIDCKHCSRTEEKEGIQCKRTVLQPEDNWSPENLRKEQLKDEEIGPILKLKEEGERPKWQDISVKSPVFKCYWAQWDSLDVENGVLVRKWESADGKEVKTQTVLPQSRRKAVLKEIHGGTSGAHFGVTKTLDKLRQRFYWVGYSDDVKEWCRRCAECTTSKGPMRRTRGAMKQYNVGAPFERIAIDVAGPFPKSRKGNKYILVASDYFSKWTEAYALPNQETATVAEALVDNMFCRFGVPLELHSDQGRNFESAVFKKVCEIMGIRKTRTTPLHPQSDGMVERFNKTLENHLKMFVNTNQTDWDEHIPLILLAYRSAVHETTGRTPASVVFGKELRLPGDLLFGSPTDQETDVEDYAEDLRQKLRTIHSTVRNKIKIESDRMKTRYDIRISGRTFQENDKVWLYNPARKKGCSPKLQKNWDGPYSVVKKINDLVYRIQRSPKAKMKVVHLDRLLPYVSDDEDSVRDEQI